MISKLTAALLDSLTAKIAAWLSVVLLAILSLLPRAVEARTGAPGMVEHIVAYLLTAVAFAFGYPRRHWITLAACLSAYGCLLEVAQNWVPERTPNVLGVTANAIGAIVGAFSISKIRDVGT